MELYRKVLRQVGMMAACWVPLVSASAQTQNKVVADFEDAGTWRMRESSGLKPGAWWPAEVGLAGSDRAQGRDGLVGELKFAFGPAGTGPFRAGFERAKMSLASGFLDGIEWDAHANHLPVSLRFQLQDSASKNFTTKPVVLAGDGWRHYRLDINADTLPDMANCQFPARLKRVTVEAVVPCEGRVWLDDLTLTGRFTKKDRLSVTPVYEKISGLPDEDVTLRYRVRSGQSAAISGTLRIEVKDFDGRSLLTKASPFAVAATGATEVSFAVGKFPLGAYEVALTVNAGVLELKEQDHFVVMVPNAGRPNKRPMWFGVGDPASWQGDLENRRHWEWMRHLGADINRMEFFPDRFEPEEGVLNEPGWRRLIQGQADAGVDVMVLYSGTPPWTHSKFQWRGVPDLWPKFEAHARHLAGFLKEFPNVTYLEFWNEPDLDFFHGSLEDFGRMFEHFSKGFKAVYPDLRFTSGGVTVKHPREKPGFSKGMYQRTAPLYDVAAYHAHGPVINNETHQQQVEEWLKEAGLEQKRIFNTETGERSLYTAEGRRRQAITLVKKIVFSKSRPNFDGYFWFTLQDYWDMDPDADDSFGLITTDNRAKASFAAYNTLIRQLANTTPVADAPKVKDLTLYAFRRDDGRYVYAGWPETKSSAIFWIKTRQKLAVSNMFGVTREYASLGGMLPVPIGELPLYLSGATAGESIQSLPPGEEFLQVEPEIRYTGAARPVAIPVRFRNPTPEVLTGALVLRDREDQELARRPFEIDAGQAVDWTPEVAPAMLAKSADLHLDIILGDARQPAFSFPVRCIETYLIKKIPALGQDPAAWPALDAIPRLSVNHAEQVCEMAYDPNTPAWKGPQDLSAAARVVHDGRGLRFQIAVTDDVAGPAQPNDQLFRGDDVQVAIGRADAKKFTVLDLGHSTAGPAVWCSEQVKRGAVGAWDVPLRITRSGTVTRYDVYLPFEKLGLSAADKNLRFSFLVNENDGKGRVRWIEWTPGIARDRSIESLGHGLLE